MESPQTDNINREKKNYLGETLYQEETYIFVMKYKTGDINYINALEEKKKKVPSIVQKTVKDVMLYRRGVIFILGMQAIDSRYQNNCH